jgi:GT2 family glycosyltransferase
MNMPLNLFITVNYCQAEITIHLLKNIAELTDNEKFIIVVADNSPYEENFIKLEEFKRNFPWPSLLLFRSPSNIGYFGAVDHVLKEIDIAKEDLQILIVSNNDIEINDKDFFVKLLSLDNKAAVIAPDIISVLTGQHQNPHRKYSISKSQKIQYHLLFSNYYFGYLLYLFRKTAKWFMGINLKKETPEQGQIFSAHGAFMIFTNKYFKAGGKIDNDFFLYAEEDSVAAQCANLNLEIIFHPELIVFHNEHISTNSSGFKKIIYKIQKKSYKHIKSKYPEFY